MSAQDGQEVAHVHRHDSKHPKRIVRLQILPVNTFVTHSR